MSKLSLNDHLRRLTYDIDTASKIASLDYILDSGIINDRTVSAVMITLDDRSEDETLRKHGMQSIQMMLEHTRYPEEKDCIMRQLMTRIFGRYDDETLIGHKDLFRTVVETIRNNIDDMDHLFVHLMHSVKKVQEVNFNSEQLPYQVAKFFESTHQKDNLRSKRAFSRIANERHLETLFNPDTPLNTLESTLELLGERPLEKIDFNLVVAHLSPVLNQKHPNASRIVKLALNNILRWTQQFPDQIEEVSRQRISIYNWFHAPDEHTIDDLTMKQLGMNAVFVPELVGLLTEPKKQKKTLSDPAQLFQLLKNFNNVRFGKNMERICDYIISEKHAANPHTFPYLDAIDFLKSHFTGLDAYQPPSESNEQISHEERYRRKLLVDRNLKADQEIKSALLHLIQNDKLPDQIRVKAWSVIIEAMPADLFQLLNDHLPSLQTNGSLINGTLHSLQSIYPVQAYPLLKRLWLQRKNFDLKTQEQVIRTLGAVGSFDIVALLIPVVFDDSNEHLKQLATDVLVNEGYEVEIQKEAHRRMILSLHGEEKEVSENIVKTEEQIKRLHLDIHKTQVNYNLNSQELAYHLNEMESFILGRKLEMTDNAIDQAKIKGKIEILLQKLGEVYEVIRVITERLNKKVDHANRLLSQVRNIEQEILKKDGELKQARKDLIRNRSRINELKTDQERCSNNLSTISNKYKHAESDLNALRGSLNKLGRELNDLQQRQRQAMTANSGQSTSNVASIEGKIRSKEQENSSLRSRFDQQNNTVNTLNAELKREQARLQKIGNDIANVQNSIAHLERLIPQLERDIANLQRQHNDLALRLREMNNDIEQFRANINQHSQVADQFQAEVRQLQMELDVIINRFNAIQEQTKKGTTSRGNYLSQLEVRGRELNQLLQNLGKSFTETENSLNHLKTAKQHLVQQLELERTHYDYLGDRSHQETTTANLNHQHRSDEFSIRSKGDDEVRLGKDKIIERSAQVFSERFVNTRSLEKRIKNSAHE